MNPFNADPSRTTMLRKQYTDEIARRWAAFRKALVALIVDEDALGLRPNNLAFTLNVRWAFQTSDQKLGEFQKWVQSQIDANLLSIDGSSTPWNAKFITSAHRQGLVRSFIETNPDVAAANADFYKGTQAQFLQDAFNQPEMASKVKLLGTRAFEELKGITAQMGSKINRVLADGLANGQNPKEIARKLVKEVDISKARAKTIARTEIVHAHAEGQLDGFEALGVEEVGVYAEWSTAGDDRVCKLCSSLSGIVLKVKDARGLIPRHPNCRCSFIPALKGMREKGQRWGKKAIERAIRISARAERPKSKTPLKDSRWRGADVKISKRQNSK